MKRVLALDSSTWWGSVSLVERQDLDPPRVVVELGRRIEDSHSEHLLRWIERALAEAGWSKSCIDAYAATRGPGSFTGIRVGLGTVRGLGLATGRPCLGVTTLEAIAFGVSESGRDRFPVMAAGRGELYAARYDPHASPPEECEAPWIESSASVVTRVMDEGGVIITGPGTEVETPSGPSRVPLLRSPDKIAGAAGCIAAYTALERASDSPLAPLYIRPPDALLKLRR